MATAVDRRNARLIGKNVNTGVLQDWKLTGSRSRDVRECPPSSGRAVALPRDVRKVSDFPKTAVNNLGLCPTSKSTKGVAQNHCPDFRKVGDLPHIKRQAAA